MVERMPLSTEVVKKIVNFAKHTVPARVEPVPVPLRCYRYVPEVDAPSALNVLVDIADFEDETEALTAILEDVVLRRMEFSCRLFQRMAVLSERVVCLG